MKLFERLKNMFSDKTDTWDNPAQNLPVPQKSSNSQSNPGNGQSAQSQGGFPFEWREQIVENEFAAENCTQEHKSVNVFGRSAGGNIPCSHSNESFTDDGLVSERTEALMTTADGRLIKPEELHGGGKCFSCGALTDKIFFCAVCKIPLCFRCVKKYKNLDVCLVHLKELNFREDTWSVENE